MIFLFIQKSPATSAAKVTFSLSFAKRRRGELQSAADEAVYNDAVRVTKAGLDWDVRESL